MQYRCLRFGWISSELVEHAVIWYQQRRISVLRGMPRFSVYERRFLTWVESQQRFPAQIDGFRRSRTAKPWDTPHLSKGWISYIQWRQRLFRYFIRFQSIIHALNIFWTLSSIFMWKSNSNSGYVGFQTLRQQQKPIDQQSEPTRIDEQSEPTIPMHGCPMRWQIYSIWVHLPCWNKNIVYCDDVADQIYILKCAFMPIFINSTKKYCLPQCIWHRLMANIHIYISNIV